MVEILQGETLSFALEEGLSGYNVRVARPSGYAFREGARAERLLSCGIISIS